MPEALQTTINILVLLTISQGRIFLKPQSWAMLSGAADQANKLIACSTKLSQQLVDAIWPDDASAKLHQNARRYWPLDAKISGYRGKWLRLQPCQCFLCLQLMFQHWLRRQSHGDSSADVKLAKKMF